MCPDRRTCYTLVSMSLQEHLKVDLIPVECVCALNQSLRAEVYKHIWHFIKKICKIQPYWKKKVKAKCWVLFQYNLITHVYKPMSACIFKKSQASPCSVIGSYVLYPVITRRSSFSIHLSICLFHSTWAPCWWRSWEERSLHKTLVPKWG